MEEVIEFIENILALSKSLSILSVAPEYGAGEMPPQSLQRVADLIAFQCKEAIAKVNQFMIMEHAGE
jgi:hypothetical protein